MYFLEEHVLLDKLLSDLRIPTATRPSTLNKETHKKNKDKMFSNNNHSMNK
jgi:hypothetical protein